MMQNYTNHETYLFDIRCPYTKHPAVFLDIHGAAYLSSGYGKQPCFPHIFPANLIFFSGPVLLSYQKILE
jgi:hypothetical protein